MLCPMPREGRPPGDRTSDPGAFGAGPGNAPATPVVDPVALRIGVAVAAGPGPPDADRWIRAEASGAEVLWIVRGPDARDCDLLHCAAAAVATSRRLRIVVGGVTWPPPSWLRAAEDLATLDALSGGRLEVALHAAPPDAGMEELSLLRRAWGSGPVHHAGARRPVDAVDGVDVHPKPHQPGGPPLWLPSGPGDAAASADRARRAGAGLVVLSPEEARRLLARTDPGPPPARLAVLVSSTGGAAGARRGDWASAARERARRAGLGRIAPPVSLDWIESLDRLEAVPSGGSV